jgi:type I restriction enzyme S subunit
VRTPDAQLRVVPKLRFREFSDEWKQKQLSEMVDFSRGLSLSKSDLKVDGKYSCIHYGELFTQYSEVITEVKSRTDISTGVKSKIGDILMPTSDVTPQGLAKASSIQRDGVMLGGDINILRPKAVTNSVMLSYMLNFQKKKIMTIVSGTTVRHVYSKDLSKLKYLTPSNAEEQQKIAMFLMTMDDKISALGSKVDLLKTYKKGVMQELFTQRIRFKNEKGQDYPAWKVYLVRDIFTITRGNVLAAPLTRQTMDSKYQYPVYSSQTKDDGLMGFYDKYLYENAITWTTDGANAGEVKYRDGKFYCTNVCGVLLSNDGFANSLVAEAIHRVAKKYVSYVGNPKLMNNVMAIIKINLPQSVDEQQKIANFLTSIDDKIQLTKKELEQAKVFKKALLQQMFV